VLSSISHLTQRPAPVNLNLKARWNVSKWRAPGFAGAARRLRAITDACLGPKRCDVSPRLGFLILWSAAPRAAPSIVPTDDAATSTSSQSEQGSRPEHNRHSPLNYAPTSPAAPQNPRPACFPISATYPSKLPRPSSSPPASQHPPEQSICRSRRLAPIMPGNCHRAFIFSSQMTGTHAPRSTSYERFASASLQFSSRALSFWRVSSAREPVRMSRRV